MDAPSKPPSGFACIPWLLPCQAANAGSRAEPPLTGVNKELNEGFRIYRKADLAYVDKNMIHENGKLWQLMQLCGDVDTKLPTIMFSIHSKK